MNPIPPTLSATFPTGRPLEDKPDIVQCKQCKKPIMRTVAKDHIEKCLKKKQEKIQKKKEAKEAKELAARREKGLLDDDDDKAKGARKSSLKGGDDDDGDGTAKKTKKRKAEEDAGGKAKKKKKDDPKDKKPKTKGPVDVEKQCGVPLPNGALCARSLTCKSHSMGAKRAVPGRSLPYDMLLAQYQKKNQAKQQSTISIFHYPGEVLTCQLGAAIDANAPLADDFDTHGPIDSDEEREAVMAAVHRARPQPLFTRQLTSTRSKYQYVRLKEMLQNALSGSQGARLFAVSAQNSDPGQRGFGNSGDNYANRAGSMGAFSTDDGPGHSRRSSVAMAAGGARGNISGGMAAPARRPSLSSTPVASVT